MMGNNGIFRSAIGGFNKKDVLQYIDQITGEWNAERQQLTTTAAAAQEEAQLQAKAAEAQAASVAAMTAQLQQLQETLAEVTATAQAVPALQEQLDTLNGENEALRAKLDAADAAAQASGEQTASLQREVNAQNGQLAEYRLLLGQSRTAHAHMQSIVRPLMDDTNRRAIDTLDNVQTVISALLDQLGELQSSIATQQQAQRDAAADDATRLTDALDHWLDRANRLAADAPAGSAAPRFFR